jgi:hypothetical protein
MFLTNKQKIMVGKLIPTKEIEFDDSKNELTIDISSKKFSENKGEILVDRNNKIIDGHHRVFLLKKYYGDDYTITIEKLLVPKLIYFISVFSIAYTLIGISFLIEKIFFLIKKIIKTPKKYFNGFKKSRSRNKRYTE